VFQSGKRRYVPVNKKKVYPDGTVFCLRYERKWETLTANNLSTALAARALKEAALLKEQPSAAKGPAKRIGIDDAINVYLSNTAATKNTGPYWHTPWLRTSSARAARNNSWMNSLSRT
jgi:hypothetical protein